jgi:hypothetical protein
MGFSTIVGMSVAATSEAGAFCSQRSRQLDDVIISDKAVATHRRPL